MREGEERRQIVAIGGAGLSLDEGLLLPRYVLSLASATRPRVCYIGTASGDRADNREQALDTFRDLGAEPTHLSLIPNPSTDDPASVLLQQDVLWVGGGNTKNMLALWRAWGIDHLVRAAWERGTVLAGQSAGSICWFAQGTTDSVPGRLTALECLGFLAGSNSPHYDSEPERRPYYRRMIGAGLMLPGLAADDGVGLHFVGTALRRVVGSRPDAHAYRVGRGDGGATETEIVPDYLGSR